MRKIEYTILADVIRKQMEKTQNGQYTNPETVAALQNVARGFAMRSSVNEREFMKQCGVPTE